jgi:hypothetical protein
MRTLDRVPAWLWLWASPAIVAAQIGAKAIEESLYRRWMRGERGLVEGLTFLFLVAACVCALRAYRLRARVRWRLFGPAALAFAAGLAFFAGEEASWGQHWLGFEPPENIALRNDQGEFNLHNDPFFEKLLDQLPRTLLTIAALVGGVIVPLTRRRSGAWRDFESESPFGWAWPSRACLPSALLVVGVTLPEKLFEAFDRPVPYLLEISAGETKEYALAVFLLVYTLGLFRDLRTQPAPLVAAPGVGYSPPA